MTHRPAQGKRSAKRKRRAAPVGMTRFLVCLSGCQVFGEGLTPEGVSYKKAGLDVVDARLSAGSRRYRVGE
jgi:hypothetical protein